MKVQLLKKFVITISLER